MNRYRTVPGLGPSASKATSTTTCQKCLKKGHYSYECNASVQSRPYMSRPSRSQQLQNPKLKPTLAEHKMEEAKPVNQNPSQSTAESEIVGQELGDVSQEEQGPSKKRRRSASFSSNSSIDTISTNASEPETGIKHPPPNGRRNADGRSRSSSAVRSRSPRPHFGGHRTKHQREDRRSRLSKSEIQLENEEHRSDHDEHLRRPERTHVRHDNKNVNHDNVRGRDRPGKRRRSRSAEGLPDDGQRRGVPGTSTRPRSLSPYSRRLALTQAMNSGN